MHPTPSPGYSTRVVAQLVDLSSDQVRAYVHAGFLRPRREARGAFRFSFQDLIVLRAVRSLVAARIPAQRVRRVLRRLQGQLPRERSLTAVRIIAERGRIIVRQAAEVWEPESGQRRLDFGADEQGQQLSFTPTQRDADRWFTHACALEVNAPDDAAAAYRRVLELVPDHADAHLNLGRLLHEGGALEEAEAHYRQAVGLLPADATAAFNLGVALQDLGCPEEAIEAYRRAVAIDPACADAHFNLAVLYEDLGYALPAYRSLKAYKLLTESLL